MPQYAYGCHRCTIFENGEEDRAILERGALDFHGEQIPWIVFESRPKAMLNHVVFTTPEHHLGPEATQARAELNKVATFVAANIFDHTYRLLNNSGGAASEEHYHLHIYGKAEGERYLSVVANVMKVLREELLVEFPTLPLEVVEWLDGKLLQQR